MTHIIAVNGRYLTGPITRASGAALTTALESARRWNTAAAATAAIHRLHTTAPTEAHRKIASAAQIKDIDV